MAARSNLKRKALFVDEVAVRRARRALGATTDAEAVRLSVERASWRWKHCGTSCAGVAPSSGPVASRPRSRALGHLVSVAKGSEPITTTRGGMWTFARSSRSTRS